MVAIELAASCRPLRKSKARATTTRAQTVAVAGRSSISEIEMELLPATATVWALVVVALAFDFLNGLHDAANSIATIVSTRVLKPRYAVAWAAFFNFVAFLVFGSHVAQTIGTGIVSAEIVDHAVV